MLLSLNRFSEFLPTRFRPILSTIFKFFSNSNMFIHFCHFALLHFPSSSTLSRTSETPHKLGGALLHFSSTLAVIGKYFKNTSSRFPAAWLKKILKLYPPQHLLIYNSSFSLGALTFTSTRFFVFLRNMLFYILCCFQFSFRFISYYSS